MRKMMNVTLYRPAKRVLSSKWAVPSVAGIGSVLAGASGAFAASDMAALFGLVDVSGAQTQVYTVLGALVLIGMLFFGRRILARLGVSI